MDPPPPASLDSLSTLFFLQVYDVKDCKTTKKKTVEFPNSYLSTVGTLFCFNPRRRFELQNHVNNNRSQQDYFKLFLFRKVSNDEPPRFSDDIEFASYYLSLVALCSDHLDLQDTDVLRTQFGLGFFKFAENRVAIHSFR